MAANEFNLTYENNYSPSSDVYSPESFASSIILSSPEQLVPLYNYDINYPYFMGFSNMNTPRLEIIEQPTDRFRFRYESEMSGTHGCLFGESSNKSFPTVMLHGFNDDALIVCTIAQIEPCRKPHPHRLNKLSKEKGRNVITGTEEPHKVFVPISSKQIAEFRGLAILYTGRKHIKSEMVKKFSYHPSLKIENTDEDIDFNPKNINLNSVRLRFDAYRVNGEQICEPVFSRNIDNQKSAETCQLKIINISRGTGSPEGGQKMLIFVEKVNKKNIQVIFFQLNQEGNTIWRKKAEFGELDVHHQFGISFKTPPYKDIHINEEVDVLIELYRPSDQAVSKPVDFRYVPIPQINRKKRPRIDAEFDIMDTINCDRNEELKEKEESYDLKNILETPLSFNIDSLVDTYIWSPFENNKETHYETDGDTKVELNRVPDLIKRICTDYSMAHATLLKKFIECLHLWRTKTSDRSETGQKLLEFFNVSLKDGENIIHLIARYNWLFLMKCISDFWNTLHSYDYINDVINHRSNSGNTPLHVSIINSLPDMAHLLLKSRANPMVSDHEGNTPLHLCIVHESFKCIQHLLRYNKKEYTFGYRVDLDKLNNDDKTPLQAAGIRGSLDMVQALINAGASINKKTMTDGKTVLHFAVENDHLTVVEYLIKNDKINIDEPDSNGSTALHYVCVSTLKNSTQIAEVLLNEKADPYITCGKNTPFKLATNNKMDDKINLIKEHSEAWDLTVERKNKIKDNTSESDSEINDQHGKRSDNMDNLVKILDESGRWRDLVVKLDREYLLRLCEVSASPSRIILNDLQLESGMSLSDIVEGIL